MAKSEPPFDPAGLARCEFCDIRITDPAQPIDQILDAYTDHLRINHPTETPIQL